MSSSCQRLLTDGQRLLSDAQRLFTDASTANNRFPQPVINAGTSISQIMGDIGVPSEFSGFPATNISETPEAYELHSEVPGVDKDSIKIEVPDGHTLTILGKIQDCDSPIKKDDKMEEDAISPVDAETQTESGQPQEAQNPSTQQDENANESPSSAPPKNEKGEKPRWWANERVLGSFGSFRRSFFFLDPIKVDGATATIKSGVVKIVLPKAKNVKSDIQLIQLED